MKERRKKSVGGRRETVKDKRERRQPSTEKEQEDVLPCSELSPRIPTADFTGHDRDEGYDCLAPLRHKSPRILHSELVLWPCASSFLLPCVCGSTTVVLDLLLLLPCSRASPRVYHEGTRSKTLIRCAYEKPSKLPLTRRSASTFTSRGAKGRPGERLSDGGVH